MLRLYKLIIFIGILLSVIAVYNGHIHEAIYCTLLAIALQLDIISKK